MNGKLGTVSIKGIVVGSLFDIVGTSVWGMLLAMYLTAQYTFASVPQNQLADAVLGAMRDDPVVWTVNLLVGGFFSVAGGYISARIAGRNEALNGALASFLCVGLGVYSLVSRASGDALWLQLILLALSPALASLGGVLRLRQRTRPRRQQPAF